MNSSQVNTAAFAASTYGGSKDLLPSTEALPPRPSKLPDVEALAEAKQDAISRYALPDRVEDCAFCGKPMQSIDCEELPNGDVVRHCRLGCLKTHVVYQHPDITYPKFKKVCMFEENNSLVRQLSGSGLMRILPIGKSHSDIISREQHKYMTHPVTGRVFSVDAKCKLCGKKFHEHDLTMDSFGWAPVGLAPMDLPKNWPVWQPETRTWASERTKGLVRKLFA